jgi:hypothetical protein
VLKRALKFVGFAILLLATVYFIRAVLEIQTALDAMDANILNTFSETKTMILREIVDFVEGLGLGLICLYLGMKDER